MQQKIHWSKLKTRISAHRSDIKSRHKNLEQKTALANHCAIENQQPHFEKTKVLEKENNYNKRFLLEMLHIIKTPYDQRMNYKADTENCAQAYRYLVSDNKNS